MLRCIAVQFAEVTWARSCRCRLEDLALHALAPCAFALQAVLRSQTCLVFMVMCSHFISHTGWSAVHAVGNVVGASGLLTLRNLKGDDVDPRGSYLPLAPQSPATVPHIRLQHTRQQTLIGRLGSKPALLGDLISVAQHQMLRNCFHMHACKSTQECSLQLRACFSSTATKLCA